MLRTHKLGEADRIVSFVTERHGKVRAVAKGVRKTKSRFGARLEPTSHVAVQFYEGRELDIVTQAESVDHFRAIRVDLDRLTRAVSMLEAVDQLAQEREVNPELYRMLLGALRTLAARDSALVLAGFFWKLLALEGFRPITDSCAMCGATDELVAFDLHEGGVLCRTHRRGTAAVAGRRVDAPADPRRAAGGGPRPTALAGRHGGGSSRHPGHGAPPRTPPPLGGPAVGVDPTHWSMGRHSLDVSFHWTHDDRAGSYWM